MFEVEYRTISRLGVKYSTHLACVGSHKAVSCDAAAEYFLAHTPNVEVIGVRYVGAF